MDDKMKEIFNNLANDKDKDELVIDDTFKEVILDSEYDKSGFIGKLMHLWKWRFYLKHYKNKKLTIKDIPRLPTSDESEKLYKILEREWTKEKENAEKKKRDPTLFWPILKIYGPFLIFLSIFGFIGQFSVLYQAICMRDLISHTNMITDLKNSLSSANETLNADLDSQLSATKNKIYLTCFIMILMQWLYTNAINVYNYHTVLIGYRIKISISSMIYRKTLKLSKSAFANTDLGQIQQLLSSDMNRIESIFYLVAYPFIGIILTFVTIYVLLPYLGYYTFIGILVLFSIVPIQSYLGKLFSYVRFNAAKLSDERMKQMNEFIPAIRVIKMYCWENQFAQMISQARQNEIKKIRNCLYLFSCNMSLFYSGAKLIIYVTLVFYVVFSTKTINAELVYVTFATFNKLSFICFLYLPHFILSSVNGLIAIKRIDKFLKLDEIETDLDFKEDLLGKKANLVVSNLSSSYAPKNPEDSLDFEKDKKTKKSNKNKSKKMNGKDNHGFMMEESKNNGEVNILQNLNFSVDAGELLVIVGKVGSGKSSVLLSILGELFIKQGHVQVNGRYSYSSQEAWAFAGTVKENILFSCQYDEEKYKEVVRVCALERDITLFPHGDQTIIGERGVALSGGQRARINLARALYYDADIYLLDDPLSAVDPHVAKHIFKEAIQGYLKDKVVVLVTHQLQFVKNSNKVLLLKEGRQIQYGDYNDPMTDFSSFVLSDLNDQREQSERTRRDSNKFGSTISITAIANAPKIFSRQDSVDSIQQSRLFEDEFLVEEVKLDNNKELTIFREIEADSAGLMKGNGASVYVKAGSTLLTVPLVIFLFLVSQLSFTFADYFLKMWVSHEQEQSNKFVDSLNNQTIRYEAIKLFESLGANELAENNVTNDYQPPQESSSFMDRLSQSDTIYIYSSIILCLVIFCLLRSLMFFKFCMKASVNIHDSLFKKIVRSPLRFFDKNPNQFQILNRFSKDIQILDDVIPYRFFDFIDIAITDLSICILIFFINYYLIIPISVLFLLVVIVSKFYLNTARNIATIEGISKAPTVQHLSSTVNGITTIKAFRSQKRFIRKFDMYQNDYSSSLFTLITSRRWLVYIMDHVQIFFIAGILITVALFLPDGPTTGLIVSNVLSLVAECQWLVINYTDFVTFLTSVERLDQYSDIEQEPPLESTPDKKPADSWPEFGRIEFRNVTMRYFEGENPVLKNLNFVINSKEKIGVVGRTGAGKSSLISALFRMNDYEGDIFIDDINVKEIGLHDLRKKISIIPQEPILFTGTVRSNLDPTSSNEHSDNEMWEALREAQLESVIKELDGGLDAKIVDSGSCFSIGQKQLICLARAVLKRNKILILDEATANCDVQTDGLIQKTVRSVFKDMTMLTVAHRLNTIIDSDKILVLDSGELKEFDTPYNLVRIPSSFFCAMVNATGPQNAKQLKIAAKNSSFRKLSNLNLQSS